MQQEVALEISSVEEEGVVTFAVLKLKNCVSIGLEHMPLLKYHPDKAVVNRNVNLFSDNVINHFRKIMKSHQYQATLQRWFSKESKPDESQSSTSGVKRTIQQTPEAVI